MLSLINYNIYYYQFINSTRGLPHTAFLYTKCIKEVLKNGVNKFVSEEKRKCLLKYLILSVARIIYDNPCVV